MLKLAYKGQPEKDTFAMPVMKCDIVRLSRFQYADCVLLDCSTELIHTRSVEISATYSIK